MLNGPPPSSTDPLEWLVRNLQRTQQQAQGVQQGLAPAIAAAQQVTTDQPVSSAFYSQLGFDYGTFDISNSSTYTLDVGSLSTAAPPAYHGCAIIWHVVRGTGATAHNGGGWDLIFVNYWNGTGHGAWPIGMNSQGDNSHKSGITFGAVIATDNLHLVWTADASGSNGKGQYWIKRFPALQDTTP